MAKIIKAKVYVKRTSQGTSYSGGYPIGLATNKTIWLAEGDDGKDSKGTYVIKLAIVLDNSIANTAIATGQAWEVGKTEANEFGRKLIPQKVKMTDGQKVAQILDKQAKGGTLTQKEMDTLDPDNEEVGVNRSKLFDINDYLS